MRYFVLALTVILTSCGMTPRDTARATLDATAIGLAITDQTFARAYSLHAHDALEAAQDDLAAYRADMAPWDDVERALRVADAALRTADAAIESWDAGGRENWLGLAACVAGALDQIRLGLEALGLEIPTELDSVLNALAPYGRSCTLHHGGE